MKDWVWLLQLGNLDCCFPSLCDVEHTTPMTPEAYYHAKVLQVEFH